MPAVPEGLDHLVYGVPDLDTAVEALSELVGVRPAPGGRHSNYGTRNALLSLGPETYLEILAPDPEAPPPPAGRLFGLDRRSTPRLVTWVLRREKIDEAAARAREAGVELGALQSGNRERPDGSRIEWRLTDPYALPLDGVVPFLIHWGATPHPARSAPPGGRLVELRAVHPHPTDVVRALGALGATMPVDPGVRPRLVATIETASGSRVELR